MVKKYVSAIKKKKSKNVLGKIKVDLHKILIIWGASCWRAKWVVSKVAEEPSVPRDRNVSAAEAGHTSECLKGRSQAAQQAQLAEAISFFIINIIFFFSRKYLSSDFRHNYSQKAQQ